jgi:hypothetical protein
VRVVEVVVRAVVVMVVADISEDEVCDVMLDEVRVVVRELLAVLKEGEEEEDEKEEREGEGEEVVEVFETIVVVDDVVRELEDEVARIVVVVAVKEPIDTEADELMDPREMLVV